MADGSDHIARPCLYQAYTSARDIAYTPEMALNVGFGMVKEIQECIKNLELGSKLCQEVWLHEVERYENPKFVSLFLFVM
jgi:hypothetical protein